MALVLGVPGSIFSTAGDPLGRRRTANPLCGVRFIPRQMADTIHFVFGAGVQNESGSSSTTTKLPDVKFYSFEKIGGIESRAGQTQSLQFIYSYYKKYEGPEVSLRSQIDTTLYFLDGFNLPSHKHLHICRLSFPLVYTVLEFTDFSALYVYVNKIEKSI